jgi:hypothetical protein
MRVLRFYLIECTKERVDEVGWYVECAVRA